VRVLRERSGAGHRATGRSFLPGRRSGPLPSFARWHGPTRLCQLNNPNPIARPESPLKVTSTASWLQGSIVYPAANPNISYWFSNNYYQYQQCLMDRSITNSSPHKDASAAL